MEYTNSTSIVFMDSMNFENMQSWRGGALVTDILTYPQEFRLTSPIRPTPLQSMLYGSTLESYISVELIALPLIKALKIKPALIIVRSAKFLEARSKSEFPLVLFDTKSNNFKPHPNFQNDLTVANGLFAKPNVDTLLEPFSRIQTALTEAHRQKVGDQ